MSSSARRSPTSPSARRSRSAGSTSASPSGSGISASLGLVPGVVVTVRDRQPFGGPVTVEAAGERHVIGPSWRTWSSARRRTPDERRQLPPPVEELAGWRYPRTQPSLPESHHTIQIPRGVSFWRKALAFAGPGYMVAVGYMDPGNWATDLAGGARFGYTLLSVILISNLMAILLQALALKLGIVDRARPGAGLPRPLLPAGELRALGALRDRHRRLRPGRGDRLGDRAQPAVRHPADLGRLPHRARRAADPAAAEQGLPLPRGVRHRAGGDDRRLLRGRALHGAARPWPRCWAGWCRGPRS